MNSHSRLMSEWSRSCAAPELCSSLTMFNEITGELLRSGNRVRFRAVGASMQPTIEDGELITVAPVEPAAVKRGDILLYQGERGFIAHRLVGLRKSAKGEDVSYLLQGDASVDRSRCSAGCWPCSERVGALTSPAEGRNGSTPCAFAPRRSPAGSQADERPRARILRATRSESVPRIVSVLIVLPSDAAIVSVWLSCKASVLT